VSFPTTSLTRVLLHAPASTEIYTLSLHDALPIFLRSTNLGPSTSSGTGHTPTHQHPNTPTHQNQHISSSQAAPFPRLSTHMNTRSEEHTSELQSRENLVCRLLLEKKNQTLIKLHE